ncbi:UDP-N-acetylglucosamine 2-epimerase (non-hydrolyzing) [Candidatus Sumerlaeota bacterium]|nr:UDP-N-acetylglucosamine 2-epimerase (non-hydrolyzing) [Candidatus Sumerlaeota bacterium]
MKILSVFGTRPEAIKMAPVLLELARHPDRIFSRVCVTAQHREMLDQVLTLFGIVPDHDLDIMRSDQTLTQVTCEALARLDPVLSEERPDWVLVQGDTTTVLAASLQAHYHRIRLGHVEAGLRSHCKHHPFPEEINRSVASIIADLHFAPTEHARDNLLREGIPRERIRVTGNTVIDALQRVVAMPCDLESHLPSLSPDQRILLVTAHRRESFGEPLQRICEALRQIALAHPDVQIVYPVHPNPNVWQPVFAALEGVDGITLLPPLDYLTMAHLMRRAHLILTDSGGLQEEAPGLDKPVLVLRETTERPEAVEAGTVEVIGTRTRRIVEATNALLTDQARYSAMAKAINPFGDGHAAERIVEALLGA